MSTPQMPNIPGAAVMTDTLDFVKNLWGSMGVPGLTVPTMSVDELDKKINDLKAVEGWLNLNLTMLRSSIHALEVQRGTIATLKSMGQSLAETMQQKPGQPAKSMFDANPYAAAFFSHLDPARNGLKASPPPAPRPAAPTPPPARAEAAPETRQDPRQADEAPPKPDLAAAAAAQMANPAIWWNLLQDQFKQAVTTAMTPEPKAAAPTAAPAQAADPADDAKNEAEPEQDGGDAGAARKPAARKTAPKKE
jgi:hypothetical protein